MIYKYSLFILLNFIIIGCAFWAFNNINAYVGISISIFHLIFIINKISKKFKNKKDV